MISKRKLLKMRKDALIDKTIDYQPVSTSFFFRYVDKVLELTQELIDLKLIEESARDSKEKYSKPMNLI